MPAMTLPARASPVAKEIDERTASRITRGLRMMISRLRNQPRCRSCATSFGLTCARSLFGLALRQALRAVCNDEAAHLRLYLPLREQQGRRECYVASPLQQSEVRQGEVWSQNSQRHSGCRFRLPSPPRESNQLLPSLA